MCFLSGITDLGDHAMMAARNNADWYAMMWDIRGLRYTHDAHGFRAIDPPPPYHGWATAVPGAPIKALIAPLLDKPGFAVKDGGGQHDLTGMGLQKLFEAKWLWHVGDADASTDGWEPVTSPSALSEWEDAWRESSPSNQRQFPEAILARRDIVFWGRRNFGGYDAGVIANLSNDCVGLSNMFGADARGAATTLCAQFGDGRHVVGYERGDDLAQALAAGWQTVGDLAVWVVPR